MKIVSNKDFGNCIPSKDHILMKNKVREISKILTISVKAFSLLCINTCFNGYTDLELQCNGPIDKYATKDG